MFLITSNFKWHLLIAENRFHFTAIFIQLLLKNRLICLKNHKQLQIRTEFCEDLPYCRRTKEKEIQLLQQLLHEHNIRSTFLRKENIEKQMFLTGQ